jgi:hypothetical protein
MVVALVLENDLDLREKMERHFVDDLKEKDFNVVSSYQVFGPKSFRNQNEESVLSQLQSSGVDAVITIVLLDKKREQNYMPSSIYYSPYSVYQHHFWGYYSTVNSRIYSPGYYQFNTNYFWESNVYDLKNKSLLYSVQSESFDPANTNSLAHEFGQLIVSDMMKKAIFKK